MEFLGLQRTDARRTLSPPDFTAWLLAGAGILAGVFALPGSWVLAHDLPGLSSIGVSVILGSVGVMLAVAAAALSVPTIRACRVDPLTALRQQ